MGFFLLIAFEVGAQDIPFSLNPRTDTVLVIDTSTPPALIWVVDSLGNTTGANVHLPVNRVGEQTQNWPNGLYGIPNSRAAQSNIEDDETGEVQSTTSWDINIKTTTAQTYTLNLRGIALGVSQLNIVGLFPNLKGAQNEVLNVLVNVGTLRQIQVDFNPREQTVKANPVVLPRDLLSDIEIACQLGLIKSNKICGLLKNKAQAIQTAIDDHRNEKAVRLLQSFLCNLGELKGEGEDNRDIHGLVEEHVLTILKEEAEILLKGISRDAFN